MKRERKVSWDDGGDAGAGPHRAEPEAGAGPPPSSVADLPWDLERSPSEHAHVLFESLAAEPYETVFANPPDQSGYDWSPPESSPYVLSSADRTSQVEASGMAKKDRDWLVHNLDTGECRRLGEGALTKSFLKGESAHPKELVGRSPWAAWWAEKRAKDEQLCLAAESGSMDLLREAIEKPEDASAPHASVNSRSLYGRTALHIAASVGNPEGIELLLDAGADLTSRTDAGLTALHIASQRGHLGVVVLLLDWGAEVSPETKDHNLPLHFAAMNGHTDCVEKLLERGEIDQLGVRNSLGQRAAEVSLDIRTADAFTDYENKLSNFSLTSETTPTPTAKSPTSDLYAGRTPFHNGEVLLHNARADVVFRLLNKTQKLPGVQEGSSFAEMQASKATPEEGARLVRQHSKRLSSWKRDDKERDAGRAHGPFARIREDSPGVEKVGPESFELMERLGKGSFGEVFQVRHRSSQQIYAMKILRKSKVMSGNLLRYAVTERNVLSYIHHPYMVSLHYAFQTKSYLVMVLEYCPGGNLQQLIEREKRLQEPLAQLYTSELLLALSHLHERQIVFRDLKPDNVVIDMIGHSMLTDFGLSKEGVSVLHGTKSFCGSVAFLAPEILQRKGHRHTVDIYGLGVLLFDMLTGLPPFYHPDREKLYNNIKHARLVVPRFVSKPASSLIYAVMDREPTNRLGAQDTKDVKKHEYFDGIDFDLLMKREIPVPTAGLGSRSFRVGGVPSHRGTRPENPFTDKNQLPTDKAVNGWSFASSPGGL